MFRGKHFFYVDKYAMRLLNLQILPVYKPLYLPTFIPISEISLHWLREAHEKPRIPVFGSEKYDLIKVLHRRLSYDVL